MDIVNNRTLSNVAGKRIWLIDDVITTGSTCWHATDALLGAGASEVWLLACCRTPAPS